MNHSLFPRLTVCLAILACSGSVLADAADTVNLNFGLGVLADSNLFRSASDAEHDTVVTGTLTLALAKPLGQQRFVFDATLVDYRYARNDYLDFVARNVNALWQWTLTPALTGRLSYVRTENLNSFVDYTASEPELRRNIRQTETRRFDADWHAGGGWHLLAAVNDSKQQNSEYFREENSYEMTGGEAGIRYQWPSGSRLQIVRRQSRGDYTGRRLIGFDIVPAPFNSQYDTGFRQVETEMAMSLPLTGKSTVNLRLARQQRSHDHFSQRDYDENIGRLEHIWQITGNLGLTTALRREVGVYQDFSSSYHVSDGLLVQPVWQLAARLSARLAYDWQRRRYEGAIYPGLAERRDILRSARASLDWIPDDRLSVNLGYQRETRDSSRSGLDFAADLWSLNLRLSF